MEENRIQKKDIASYSYEELISEMEKIGEKPFRGKQIFSWIHEKLADDFLKMTNLSGAFRKSLTVCMRFQKFRWSRDRFPKKILRKNFCLNL